MKILAIDTSCDETSAAVTQKNKVLSNIVYSQIKYHKKWGGVVPDIAKREHKKKIKPVIKKALQKANIPIAKIDAVAVTIGPGLAPALEIGIAEAKKSAQKWNKPLIAVDHMKGHLLSSFAKNKHGKGTMPEKKPFPLLGLLVSGGHTQLILMKDFGKYQMLGETLDDACGEAFDKVAKMLGLEYPGGPIISKLAQQGSPNYQLPVPMKRSGDLNFSFSGLKTACLYKIKAVDIKNKQFKKDFAASFVQTAVEHLRDKTEKVLKQFNLKAIVLGGGVIKNQHLVKTIKQTAEKYDIKVYKPYSGKLITDNAGMIGVAGWYQTQKKGFVENIQKLDRKPNLKIS